MKYRTGWNTSWNQDCQEKYQQPQIGRSYHPNGKKKWVKVLLDEVKDHEDVMSEKAALKLSIQKNIRSWHLVLSVQFSCSVMSDSLQPHEFQHTRPPCPSPSTRVHSNSRPSSQWCHPAISSSVIPSPPAPNPSQHQSLFQWVNSSHEVAKVLQFQLQYHSFQRTPRADLL